MSIVLERLQKAGLALPELNPPAAKFVPYVISGDHAYISGQLPLGFGELADHKGQVGTDISIETAKQTARVVALNILFHARAAAGGNLDKIKRCVKLTVFVNSAPTFTDQPQVANEISEIMLQAFGDKGIHARSAIGVAQLPFGVSVEAEAIFEI